MIKNFIIKYFPSLGRYKRFLKAMIDVNSFKESYSQFGEDIYILELLRKYNLCNTSYVDVGANHPTSISNTFLLYKNQLQGIIIEPNPELIKLFKRFRKRDIPLQVGCNDSSSVKQFYISKTPVISTFSKEHNFFKEDGVYRKIYVPILTLDDCLKDFNMSSISFLNIDVEGLNREVLNGSSETCKKTSIISIEFDSDEDIDYYLTFFGENFVLDKTFGCNAIFINRKHL